MVSWSDMAASGARHEMQEVARSRLPQDDDRIPADRGSASRDWRFRRRSRAKRTETPREVVQRKVSLGIVGHDG
jgi:hypothetical protein